MRSLALHRPSVGILIAALLLTVTIQHVTVTPVDARTDDSAKPTIFLHGYNGGNCEADWGFLLDHLRANGWTGGFYIPRYMSSDTSCNARPGVAMGCMSCFGAHDYWFGHTGTTHSNNTSIRHLAWHLAIYISPTGRRRALRSMSSRTRWVASSSGMPCPSRASMASRGSASRT